MAKETIDILVNGGKATPAPPLGPTLSQHKLNVGEVVQEINKKTASFAGMQVPVKVTFDPATKKFEISVGSPPVSALLKKEAGIEKMTYFKEGKKFEPGSISLDAVVRIAKSKGMAGGLHAKVKQVLGTCVSGGLLVDSKPAKQVIQEINEGKIKIE